MHIPCAGSDQPLPSTFSSPTQRPTTQPPPPPSVGLTGKGPHAQLLVCKNSCVLHKRVGYLQTGPLCCHIVSYRKLIHYSAASSRINGHLRETWSKVFSSLAVSCQQKVQKVHPLPSHVSDISQLGLETPPNSNSNNSTLRIAWVNLGLQQFRPDGPPHTQGT